MKQRGFHYKRTGKLIHEVTDVEAANEYLHEYDMTEFLGDIAPPVIYIRWDLTDADSYEVTAIATRELTEQEITDLTEWVSGQNSDGLGEGFEQQDFASVEVDREEDEDEESYLMDGGWGMASFDWQANKSRFVLVQP